MQTGRELSSRPGLATRTGFPPSTLRYYEQVGLLAAPARSSGGYRLYDEAAVAPARGSVALVRAAVVVRA